MRYRVTIVAEEEYSQADLEECFNTTQDVGAQIAQFWKETLLRDAISLRDIRVSVWKA